MADPITEIKKVAFIGDYLPRKCGIATFTNDLRSALAVAYPNVESFVVPVNDLPQGYTYPPEVRFEFAEGDLDSYRRTADYLNFSNADIVCLQHEYGIYGGPAGSFILALLRDLRIPVVTTLHTVLSEPNDQQRRVLQDLGTLSSRLVVMSQRGRTMLQDVYGIPEDKIDLIAHGIPDLPFVDSNFYKDQFGVEGKHVLLTFGLLSPNKGIENVLRALPEIVQKVSQPYLPHPRRDASQSGARTRRGLSTQPRTSRAGFGHQAPCQLLQPLRGIRRAESIPGCGRYLHHPVS